MEPRTVSASITTAAPAAAIFDIVADPRQHARIDGSGSVRDLISGPERVDLGDTFSLNMKMGIAYKITSTVVEFEEGRLIAWRHPGGHVWRYEIEAEGELNRITETFDYSTVSNFRAFAYAVSGSIGRNQRSIEETLVRLAAAAEEDAVNV